MQPCDHIGCYHYQKPTSLPETARIKATISLALFCEILEQRYIYVATVNILSSQGYKQIQQQIVLYSL